jgi:hypothetical protein
VFLFARQDGSLLIHDKIVLSEHLLAPEIEAIWDDHGEVERNGATVNGSANIGDTKTARYLDALSEIGGDRVLFSVDYPYESMQLSRIMRIPQV